MTPLSESARADLLRKALSKLPELFSLPGVMLPDSSVIEQASGMLTAHFTASLLPPGARIADLTAGLGVNTFCFSQTASHVYALERDTARAQCLKHNFNLTGLGNIDVIEADCLDWLKTTGSTIDIVFVDPSRRDAGRRVVALSDCSPAVVELLPLLPPSSRLLLKASPLLDISAAMTEIPGITAIYIVEVGREVKELLLDVNIASVRGNSETQSPSIHSVRLYSGGNPDIVSFSYDDREMNASVPLIEGKGAIQTGAYIYEPSPSLMKSGMFGALSARFEGMKQLSRNTHLFLSTDFYPEFPGRIFSVGQLLGSSDLKRLKGGSFNVISRNHPVRPSELTSRLRLRPSDSTFLIACKAGADKVIVKASRV